MSGRRGAHESVLRYLLRTLLLGTVLGVLLFGIHLLIEIWTAG